VNRGGAYRFGDDGPIGADDKIGEALHLLGEIEIPCTSIDGLEVPDRATRARILDARKALNLAAHPIYGREFPSEGAAWRFVEATLRPFDRLIRALPEDRRNRGPRIIDMTGRGPVREVPEGVA